MNQALFARVVIMAVAVIFLSSPGHSQETNAPGAAPAAPTPPAAPETTAASAPDATLDIHHDIEYASAGGISLKLDLYVPKSAAKPMPLVIWIHGGSWRAGSKEKPWMLDPLTQSGFAVASINYRLSQQAVFPAQLNDCKAAVRWLRAHAADYGINPDKIGVAGASAGGHLVALVGTTANHPELEGTEGNLKVSSTVQAVCDFFGPTDLLHYNPNGTVPQPGSGGGNTPIAKLIGGAVGDNPDKATAASPLHYVTPKACPFFIMHGDSDILVNIKQSVMLNDALKKAGVPSELYVVKGAGHGTKDPVGLQKAVDFLKQTLQGSK